MPAPTSKNITPKQKALAAARKAKEEALSPGDTLEHGLTVSVKIGGSDVWIKYSVTTKVREDETAEDAALRAHEFVTDKVNDHVEALITRD